MNEWSEKTYSTLMAVDMCMSLRQEAALQEWHSIQQRIGQQYIAAYGMHFGNVFPIFLRGHTDLPWAHAQGEKNACDCKAGGWEVKTDERCR